jgi:hypothetical protein
MVGDIFGLMKSPMFFQVLLLCTLGLWNSGAWWTGSDAGVGQLVHAAGLLASALGAFMRWRSGETWEAMMAAGWTGDGPGHRLQLIGSAIALVGLVLMVVRLMT